MTFNLYSIILLGFVPNYRCAVKECEKINITTYYDKEHLPFDNREETNLTFFSFVKLGIGLIDPSSSLNTVGKTCQRINPAKLDLTPPVIQPNFDESCEAFQNKISEHISNGY